MEPETVALFVCKMNQKLLSYLRRSADGRVDALGHVLEKLLNERHEATGLADITPQFILGL